MRLAALDPDGWQLESAEARHAASPETFRIPLRAAREALGPGDGAKLLFLIGAGEARDAPGVERMWVIVRRRVGGLYLGVLDSAPVAADGPPGLARGCDVVFAPEHVADIDRPSPDYVLEQYGQDFFDEAEA